MIIIFDDLADVAGSDTDDGLNDNVDQNELNDKISNDINIIIIIIIITFV